MRIAFLGALAWVGSFGTSWAEPCAQYVGQRVQPISFSEAATELASLPKLKGEFETTSEFETRLAKARADQRPILISVPITPSYVTYDADRRLLRVKEFDFQGNCTSYFTVFGFQTPFDGKVQIGRCNHDLIVAQTEQRKGSYTGTNAYGVRTRVARVTRRTQVIFDRSARYGGMPNFVPSNPDYLFAVPVPPDQAPALKRKLHGAVVISPKFPFYVTGPASYGRPTFDRPEEVSERLQVVVADLKCALLLGEQNEVIAAGRAAQD